MSLSWWERQTEKPGAGVRGPWPPGRTAWPSPWRGRAAWRGSGAPRGQQGTVEHAGRGWRAGRTSQAVTTVHAAARRLWVHVPRHVSVGHGLLRERARGRGLSRRHVTEHTAAGPAACPLPWPTGGAAGRREILGTFAWEQEADGLWGQHGASPYCVPARPGEGPCRVTDSRVDRRGDTSRTEEASSTRPSP